MAIFTIMAVTKLHRVVKTIAEQIKEWLKERCIFAQTASGVLPDEHQQKHKDHMANLSTQAQSLIDRTYTLMEQLLEEIMNKSIPCKLIKTIINEQENVNRFLLGNNSKRFQNGLEQANKEIRSFEERKSQIKALYELSQGMQVDVELLESTSSIDLVNEKRSLKAIMEMLLKEEPESEGGNYTYLIDIQMFEKIEVLYKSTYFKETWKETVKQAKDTDFKNVELIPLDQVHGKIFKPTLEKVRKSYEELKDLSMKLQDFENKLGKFKHCVHKELQIMAEVFSEDANTTWINNTEERINRYRELQLAEENAKVINDLKGHLQLGDFGVIEHLGDIGNKCLHDLTHDFYKVGNKVKDIPKDAIGFVKELNECFKRGFISWIKEIIKDTGELSAFVELASISAGENAMDIGKVCCFRDAISAAAPIIFQLSEKSGVEDLLQAISKLTSAIESDRNLEVKLRDSCNNREWLKIAYETHGSVERSSLRQATDINQSGIYIIKNTSAPGSKITLENCITLRCKESSVDGNDDKYREYSLSELKDLQNKLMLITASAENREDEITIYTEVLEHVINVGESYLELRDAGHILFQDWEMRAYCQHTQDAKIWVKFDITNVDIRGHRPLLDELKGLCESMRGCLTEWLKYIEQKRNMYYNLNHFTAKQLVYLCCSVAAFKKDKKSSTGLLNMLSIMKEDIKDSDVEHAFTKALQTPAETGGSQTSLDLRKFLNDFPDMIKYFLDSGFSEEQIKAAIIFCEENNQAPEGYGESEVTDEYQDIVMECIDKNQNDEEWVQEWCDKYEKMRDSVLKNQVKFKGGHGTDEISFTMTEDQIAAAFENLQTSDEKIVMLWKTYHSKLSGLVSDKFVDLDVLGETLNHLAKSATFTVKRKLAFSLEEDKPNLITCKGVEILPLFLSLYSDNDQPLPSIDEVLVCTPDTTAEEVELIIRRAVQPGSTHEKIYSLLNADKLNHDVSRKFESIFYKLVSEENLKSEGFTHKTIRISESQMRTEDIATQLQQYEDKPLDKVPRVFHFDIPPVVSKGLYRFLIQLFVLRRIQCPDGRIWRCNDSHIYMVEYTKRKNRECDRHNSEISSQMEDIFLEMFPSVKCLSPEETVTHLEQDGSCDKDYQLMHNSEFCSEAFQRTYQYFKRYKMNSLENFFFIPGSVEDSPKEWLECLLHFCDIKNPSWGELRNFTHFLNSQLKKCEQSIFCSEAVRDCLTGFKTFVVKFMITMSKDFSMRSLTTSDDSDEKESNAVGEDTVLKEFQLRRRWEQQAHPYILFNADNESMSFLGFHIHKLDAVDAQTKVVVEKNIIDKRLFNQLKTQRVPFNIDFETMKRSAQLEIISRVLGVNSVTDPDDTYQLTLDNVMKILAIHLRFECDIPVIIMGETGCGKTRLVQFMCDLLRSGKKRQNLIVVRVHGGTTSEIIYKKVREAIKISKENEVHKLDTVLFFDEANTTEAVNAIKEVICDKTVNGEQIDASRLKVIAACNPYRKHSKEAIEQLEQAGLGYRVRCENTQEKLGQIPMRQLVYRVQPLPSSLTPFVWDFGKLNEHTQELYITQMVKTFFQKENLPHEYKPLFTKVISASQKHMTELTDECRMVSLRDIERCMKTVMWFYNQKEKLFTEIDKIRGNKGRMHDLVRSLILAVGVCYLASLQNRQAYLIRISEAFSLSDSDIDTEIDLCKKAFISNVDCPSSVAKNEALNENVFMMVVCMNLRIPLFLVGKPGSSKSLSKTIAAHAMQGKASQNDLFKGYKQAQLASFQCSPHSSPDGIISIFRQCAQFQKAKNLDEYVSVVVLDEIGLAEDSPKMPLKTLHPLLEYGCTDDENADDFKKVGFIGISNWSLDPAKMNRGILVLRTSPETGELRNTACDICSSDNEHIKTEIEFLIPMLTKFYLNVLHNQPTEFFGLRDFYSLVKLIVSYATETNGRPSDENLTKAVQRNFEGLDSINILEIFWDVSKQRTNQCDTISLLRENLDMGTSGFTSRYLLLPTTNHAALQILKSQNIIDESNVEVIFGSGFAHDEEYSQVCRTVNRVKTCMETGRSVVLLNIQSLYESLYDALNQCYVKLGGIYYVDLGLGSHRVKCRVKDEFRLIVIEEKSTVYEQFPTPLLNRLEKHCLDFSSILPDHAKQMLAELEDWLDSFSTNYSGETYQLKEKSCCSSRKYDVIVGYTEDTCASVLLQCCPQIVTQELDRDEREVVLEKAKEMLIQCATPDSVLRTPKYLENNSEKLLEMYFTKQTHSNLIAVLKKYRKTIPGGICLEVSTYSRLLNKRDVEQINKELNIEENLSCLFLLNEFYTEQSFSQTDMLVDPLLLVKKSLQKGIMQLQDKLDNSQRATERIEILHGLLHNKYPAVSEPFIQSLEKRIVNHLSRQEKMEKKENWVIAQAWSDQFVAEGGSFRHVLWVHLEDTVASTLAQIMAVIDGDNNLDNLIDDQFPEKSKLWLKIFQGDQWDLLKIPVTDSQGKVSVLSTSGHKSRTCLFPFSWLLKDIFEQMWLNMMNVEGLARAPNKEYIEKFEELIPLPWIKNIKKDQDLFAMFSEDLVNISMPAYPSELNKKLNTEEGKQMEYVIEQVTGTLKKCNNNACNVFRNGEGSGRGHNLGDPAIRKEQDGERNLYGANLFLVRAMIHSAMLWGTVEHAEDVQSIIQTPHDDISRHLCDHLLKDIEMLARALGKSTEDAEMTVHLFLKFILESNSDPQIPKELKQKDANDLKILDFLPTKHSVARVVTEFLINIQNHLIILANPKEDRIINANEVKSSHVIACIPEQDFLTVAISNIDHVIYMDKKESTNYNFKTVERQLVDRFFTEKPLIRLTTIPLFEYNTGTTLRAFFITVKDKLNPFFMIEDQHFHEVFTEDQKTEKKNILANVPNMDVLITELHYVIKNIKVKDVGPKWTIQETFEAFIYHCEIEEKAIVCLQHLQEVEMRHAIALWKLAVQIKKGIKATEP
ncbi:hypothetical protein P4O66_000172 [Electrophorus voltai]|uniref:AAA+ ATPase domain-containing protein n=1 Tax=Electrophorus voltai TaxID=2609070 RepID=A0AAD9E911_9TELE|nr:hypothetical protein P4O66_000172 [Electrophorus voltai]